MAHEVEGIGLADALELLRSELASARWQAAGTDVQFPIETLTVELKVGVTRSADGKAALIKVPFVGAEFGGSWAGQVNQCRRSPWFWPPVDSRGQVISVASASEERKH